MGFLRGQLPQDAASPVPRGAAGSPGFSKYLQKGEREGGKEPATDEPVQRSGRSGVGETPGLPKEKVWTHPCSLSQELSLGTEARSTPPSGGRRPHSCASHQVSLACAGPRCLVLIQAGLCRFEPVLLTCILSHSNSCHILPQQHLILMYHLIVLYVK